MFKYIDRIFNIIRPRKLLYMAIDGVAPRAKMNQQRTRRFRNANDIKIAEEEELRVKRQFEMDGKEVLPKQETELSDPNIITPGTKFMQDMSNALKNYIKLRLSNDLGWRDIKVILSDSNVPGEGEHKIMSFIRQQRKLPSYNPNTRHCLYGLDADLIMLALAAHEVHFSLLREVVYVEEQQSNLSYKPYPDKSQLTPAATSSSLPCRRWFPNVSNSEEKHGYSTVKLKHYEFLHVWILREYLELDMQISDPPESFKFDIERIVDDFIFMCFFVGNDFLPRTPSLKLPEGAIDLLMDVYKKELKNIGGYLVDMVKVEDKEAEFIKLSRVEKFILLVGTYEEKIFKRRSELWEQKLKQVSSQHVNYDSCNASAIVSLETKSCDYSEMLIKNTKEFKQTVKDNLCRKSNLFNNVDSLIDKVKLVCPGYKERYYREKFCAYNADEIEITRINVVRHYTEGLIWVLLYYFSETPSWTWFYPFHYGPFVSDFKGLSQFKPNFVKGIPFKPFDQLLSVLPPRSVHVLPVAYQTLMKDDSPIIDFYTTDFEIDMDGCRYTWQGVCKLPFIDESRLLSETKKLVKDLGVEESERNMHKCDQLLVRSTHKLGSHILLVSTQGNSNLKGTSLSEEIGGILRLSHKYTVMDEEVHTSNEDFVLCADYEPSDCGAHIPRLLDGVKLPEKIIRDEDLNDTKLWHEGYSFLRVKQDKRYNINIHDRLRKVSINSEHMHNGYGREKSIGFDYDSKAHNINATRLSRENGNFHCDQANSVQAYGSCEKWKKVTTPWGTSLTQPNRIDQPWNSNVWTSRRAASSHNISRADVSNNWRHGSWKTNDYSSMQAKEKNQSFHHS
uniref:5'-3' exoribonuclease n=1 Tax=Cannabis sativa TaxID=3483 RepID=A0A803PXS0_CANSA